MSVTIRDIAKIVGVSHSTVSRSLNDSPLVAQKTKSKIKKVANDLGFAFNANARSLSTNSIGTIGVIYPENYGEFGPGLFYGSLLNELRETLEKHELDSIISFVSNRFTKENNIKRLILSKKIDGLIIVSSNINGIDDETMNFMQSSKVPYVFLHHISNLRNISKIDMFYTDNFSGGYLATEYLIKIGHRNIMSITSNSNTEEFNQRIRGYKEALRNYNIQTRDEYIIHGYPDINSGYNIIIEKLNFIKANKITAIFAQTDLLALGCLQAFNELKIVVPNEISIVGYDDLELIMNFKPNLTTIHQPRKELAILSCERLIRLINSKHAIKNVNVMIKPKLIIRDSTMLLIK